MEMVANFSRQKYTVESIRRYKEIKMDIFGILTLIGGLALFLYGMSVMGAGLEKLSGG